MLKKQTVWLLTMLSLMIVLSVYYLMSDDKGDLAFVGDQEVEVDKSGEIDATGDNDATEVSEIKNIGQDESFTMLRMELQNKRSMDKSSYEEIVASSNATTDEKNEALNNIQLIVEDTTKENILQNSILADTEEYQDVLVRAEEDVVHVYVKVNELSKQEVVSIMQMVRDEFGEMTVDVIQQPIDG